MEPEGEGTYCPVIGKFALAHANASGLGSATATSSARGAEYATCQTLGEQLFLYQFQKNKAHVGRVPSTHPANTEDADAKLSCRITLRDRRDGHRDVLVLDVIIMRRGWDWAKPTTMYRNQLYIPKSMPCSGKFLLNVTSC